jgi:flagellar hook-basal body complex protein FliE
LLLSRSQEFFEVSEMSQIEIDRVLSQIRSLREQTGGPSLRLEKAIAGTELGNATPKVSFASVLKNGLDSVSALQTKASETSMAFQRGTPGVELPQVMLDMQKSSIAFRGAVEVRNRMISAYQDIMNMPV